MVAWVDEDNVRFARSHCVRNRRNALYRLLRRGWLAGEWQIFVQGKPVEARRTWRALRRSVFDFPTITQWYYWFMDNLHKLDHDGVYSTCHELFPHHWNGIGYEFDI